MKTYSAKASEIEKKWVLIDATGLVAVPGGIDAHVHFDQDTADGSVFCDDFESGSRAAAAGGTTTIIDFIIPNRNQSLLEARDFWMNNAKKSVADYAFHMAVTWFGDQVKREMAHVYRKDGIQSFKIFMA